MEDWGFTRIHPSPSWPRRLLCEEYPGRFSDSPALSAAFPSLETRMTVAITLLKGFPFLFRKGRDYSGGSVPDFSRQDGNHGVPFTRISLFY